MSAPRVLVVGDVMTDVLARVDMPLAVGSDTAAKVTTRGGGSGANTATWLAALGIPATFVGRVGDDPFGPEAVALLEAAGVHAAVGVESGAATGTCVILVGGDGERTMLPDAGANSSLTPADLPDDMLRTATHLHLSAYTLLNPGSRAAGRHALRRARALGLTISVDAASGAPIDAVGGRRFRELLTGADLLLCNRDEAFAMVEVPDPAAAAVVLTRTVREVVVKVGADGAWWVQRGSTDAPVHVPAREVEAVDTTGAGDAFAAGFLAAWLLDAAPEAALRSGCASAAQAVTLAGGRPDPYSAGVVLPPTPSEPAPPQTATQAFRAARDLLVRHASDYDAAVREFRWPQLSEFAWAYDWFDVVAAEQPDVAALHIVEEDGSEARLTYRELAEGSLQLAGWLRERGVKRGDRVLMVLGNQVELWVTMLAVMRLGAVTIPATTLLSAADLRDRVERGDVRHVVADSAQAAKFGEVPGAYTRIAVGQPVEEWLCYGEAASWSGPAVTRVATAAEDPLLLYFTSGTTAAPKLVEHTQVSYPVGHLTTMYWLGLRPGDVHLNISSPGWAKHAWSNVFAPWNAGATVLVYNYARFAASALLEVMVRCEVTTFCAPPTVWRMLVQADLAAWAGRIPLREVVGAGEPLNPEVIEAVQRAWGLTLRDGYGQTETTLQIGNSPGQPVQLGSMGRPMPGYPVVLLDVLTGRPAEEGEICLDLADRPLGLMTGYLDDPELAAEATRGGHYHTGDVARRAPDGYITYVGRSDDVFKASDYRISPFELESALIEHEAVAEAAVVPSPDPLRLAVPKAYVVLAAGHEPTRETAYAILAHARAHLAPYKRVRRLEFAELPKTISGKIRRVELREREGELHGTGADSTRRGAQEFWEDDFPEIRG